MTHRLGRLLLMLLGAFAAACSMETAMNAMSSAEERQFAQDFVSNLRAGNEAWLEERMDKAAWAESRDMLKARRGLFPQERGETRMVGFEFSDNRSFGRQARTVSYTMITEAGGTWVETQIQTLAEGGNPPKVTGWNVVPHGSRPAALGFMEASEKAVPWIWAFVIGLIAVLIGIVWAIVRYNRRKREEWHRRRAGGAG